MTDTTMILAGPLAAPKLADRLGVSGVSGTLPGRLSGGADAGLGGDWPAWQEDAGEIATLHVAPTPALRRYLEVMGLVPVSAGGQTVWGLGAGGGTADWTPDRADLMAETARAILARDEMPAAGIGASRSYRRDRGGPAAGRGRARSGRASPCASARPGRDHRAARGLWTLFRGRRDLAAAPAL